MDWTEINAAIAEKLAEATKDKTGDDIVTATAETFGNLSSDVKTFLFNGGHKAATKSHGVKIKALEEERDGLTAERDKALEDIKELGKDQPDLVKLREDHSKAIEDLNAQLKTEKDGRATDLKSGLKSAFTSELSLAAAKVLDNAYSELEIIKMGDRISVSDDGKTLSVLQNGKDIPFPESDRGKLIASVVEDMVSRAPDTRKLSNSDSGGGSAQGGGSDGTKWDKIRADAKAEASGAAKPHEERTKAIFG